MQRVTLTESEAAALFDLALPQVQSKSIRAWAEGNRAFWVRIIAGGCGTLAGRPVVTRSEHDSAMVAAFIVADAIGL